MFLKINKNLNNVQIMYLKRNILYNKTNWKE